MKLTVLGCSGSVPGPESPASGYLIQDQGYTLLLDLGHGAFGALQRHIAPTAVDAIVISHLHADHFVDLTAYIVALRYGCGEHYKLAGPQGRIPLIGPAGTRDRLEAAYDPLARKLSLHELFGFSKPADTELGPFTVSFAEVNHPTPTTAVRITSGDRTLVYSADTGESDALDDTVDYAAVCETVSRIVRTERYQLLERLATRIAEMCCADDRVQHVVVTVRKLHAPVGVQVDHVAVRIER